MRGIINIIIGIGFIIGGASGEFAFRGTNSPALLIVAGVIIIIVGVVKAAGAAQGENESVLTGQEQKVLTESQKMYSFCKTCKHKSVSLETGINCGITNDKPNFQGFCANYSPVE